MFVNNFRNFVLIVIFFIISGCATTVEQTITRAEILAAKGDWIKAVVEYRKALYENPLDIELKSRLKQTELKAADYYYQKGDVLLGQKNVDGAIVSFQQGLIAMPQHSKLRQAMESTFTLKRANELYVEAKRNQETGKSKEALELLKKALTVYPEHAKARLLYKQFQQHLNNKKESNLVLNSKKPISLNFKNTSLKTAFDFIVKSFGINVIFDEGVKNIPVTLFSKNVTFEQALNLLLRTTKTFYKKIGLNTILIAPDSRDKRGQYEDHIIRTFHLKSIDAKDIAQILKSVLGIKKVIINSELNSIIIRDTQEMLDLSEKLIYTNDRKPAELILDVEILEVNRTKAERLGLDFGSQISMAFEPFVGSIKSTLNNGSVTLPGVTFRYFKQDVDAKTLANPKIRVIDSKKAKIHIGDRVPLRSSTIQDATGQTRTTFEYRDIGIRLQVTPNIHLDNSVTVSMSLEVSSLGQNLGTASEPAFSIGTRNADTIMLLKDGETAILGGLIRDEDRRARIKVPGLGDIPIIGALFSSSDDSTTRTDVLLTITPRIVRSWVTPREEQLNIFSGTMKQYSTKPLFAFLDDKAETDNAVVINLGQIPAEKIDTKGKARNIAITKQSNQTSKNTSPGILSFDKPIYTANLEQDIPINLILENFDDITEMPVELLFNPNLIEFVSVDKGNINGQLVVDDDSTKGVIKLTLSNLKDISKGKTKMAQVMMRSKQQGISYLIYKATSYTNDKGVNQKANIRASRIVIK